MMLVRAHRAASHAVAACLGLASDAVTCLPGDACHRTSNEDQDDSHAAKQDALQAIVSAAALLATSAVELVVTLVSEDEPQDEGQKREPWSWGPHALRLSSINTC